MPARMIRVGVRAASEKPWASGCCPKSLTHTTHDRCRRCCLDDLGISGPTVAAGLKAGADRILAYVAGRYPEE